MNVSRAFATSAILARKYKSHAKRILSPFRSTFPLFGAMQFRFDARARSIHSPIIPCRFLGNY